MCIIVVSNKITEFYCYNLLPQFECHILILDKSPNIILRLHTSRACNTAFTTTANFILLPQF